MDSRQLPALNWEGFARLPDKGAFRYVKDILTALGVDVEHIEKHQPHWIPAGIVGTLDWVTICGWWIYANTGIQKTDKGRTMIIKFGECELDSEMFIVFEEDPGANLFNKRLDNPGIEGKERGEALQFLREDVYQQWGKEMNLDPDEFNPPQEFLELVMWATFMWIMSPYARDWLYMKDDILACVIDYGIAFLELHPEEGTAGNLFDPTKLTLTKRPVATCVFCNTRLWCVRGAFLDGDKWWLVCISCFVERWENGHEVHTDDDRLIHPKCPHKDGIQGSTRSCFEPCPHSGITKEKIQERVQEAGSERVRRYREHVRLSGSSPRRLAGQTLDDISHHFRERDEEP